MRGFLFATTLCAFVLFGGACYSGYTGIYALDRSHDASESHMEALARDLREVLHRFGFTRMPYSPPPQFAFIRRGRASVSELRGLDGSDGVITVAVDLESKKITIRDRSHRWETPFIRALKAEVRRELAEAGFEEVEFERQMDLFF